jgi:uncharacterized membrane protein
VRTTRQRSRIAQEGSSVWLCEEEGTAVRRQRFPFYDAPQTVVIGDKKMNCGGGSSVSTTLTALKQGSWLRPKCLLFAAIGLMLAYVIPHDESFLVHPKDPVWQHFEPFKWWLLPHGIAGACALLLAPLQFSDRLRNRFRQLHRVVGRIYVAGVFVAAPLGFYIQYFQERMGDPRSFSVAAAVDAALWMITTGIAMVFILKGKVQEHRQWMTRSFAVALVFLEGRVIGGVTGWENLDVHATETIVWVCLAFSILAADLVLQWQQQGPSPSVVRRHSPPSHERMLEAPLGNPAAFACTAEGEFRKVKVVPNGSLETWKHSDQQSS